MVEKRSGIKDLVFECHLYTRQPNHLNTRQMDTILFSYVQVRYLNGWSSTYDIALDRLFEYQTICNPNFKMLGIQMFPIFRSSLYQAIYSMAQMLSKNVNMTVTIQNPGTQRPDSSE